MSEHVTIDYKINEYLYMKKNAHEFLDNVLKYYIFKNWRLRRELLDFYNDEKNFTFSSDDEYYNFVLTLTGGDFVNFYTSSFVMISTKLCQIGSVNLIYRLWNLIPLHNKLNFIFSFVRNFPVRNDIEHLELFFLIDPEKTIGIMENKIIPNEKCFDNLIQYKQFNQLLDLDCYIYSMVKYGFEFTQEHFTKLLNNNLGKILFNQLHWNYFLL
jgi:hypothetical protein